eukprot:10484501-Alexandrium_andersonii.AAC.1
MPPGRPPRFLGQRTGLRGNMHWQQASGRPARRQLVHFGSLSSTFREALQRVPAPPGPDQAAHRDGPLRAPRA